MFDLASLNAARKHRHHRHHGHHHRNRTGGVMAASTGELATFGGRKGAELLIGGWLGYMDAYSGEPMFFQTAGDASSGIGLKGLLALGANGAELVQLVMGYSFGRKYGVLGNVIDGAISGTSSASWVSWSYLQGNTYGAGKRSKEKSKSGISTEGLDYSAPARQMGHGMGMGAHVAGAQVAAGQRAAANDAFAGYR